MCIVTAWKGGVGVGGNLIVLGTNERRGKTELAIRAA